ncbi:hypothetical protein H0G86_008238 [Trichoderma simmonsii]|uniref:Uncharacterized protein n=1 Tax=Trichoderma simmonsii TaxID=1491479 RepID=A0A8G0PJ49_9HYPO|nr:hypothetical protein H0G86_008238 [Trichoderma simmonsii]
MRGARAWRAWIKVAGNELWAVDDGSTLFMSKCFAENCQVHPALHGGLSREARRSVLRSLGLWVSPWLPSLGACPASASLLPDTQQFAVASPAETEKRKEKKGTDYTLICFTSDLAVTCHPGFWQPVSSQILFGLLFTGRVSHVQPGLDSLAPVLSITQDQDLYAEPPGMEAR